MLPPLTRGSGGTIGELMAKMIKCPTCGTGIEVPPQASGQIVKCPGCGKGLKLVAKKPAGGGSGGATGGPGGSRPAPAHASGHGPGGRPSIARP
jgi:hypothetical protein